MFFLNLPFDGLTLTLSHIRGEGNGGGLRSSCDLVSTGYIYLVLISHTNLLTCFEGYLP